MRRGIPLVLLVLLVSITAFASAFVHGPYSGAPAWDSVVISWSTDVPLPARIEYSTRLDYDGSSELRDALDVPLPEDSVDTVHVTLEGLLPATAYAYRVVLLGDGIQTPSAVGSFKTAPPMGETVRFAVLSDTQQQLEGVNRLQLVGDAIAADPTDFDFILHAGDVVESPIGPYWDDWFASFGSMLLRAPFIPVLGNHERNHRTYYEAFVLPPGGGRHDEQWWALDWGDVIVVGLDTNVSKPADYFAQQDWLREQLSGPEPHKFVIFHHPVFSSDPFYGTGYQFDVIYHPIFVETGVDVVFNGHSHHYEHIVRDGVTYFVVGGGGATPRQTTPDHIQGSDVSIEGHYFYLRIVASPEGISAETVSVAQERGGTAVATPDLLLDSYNLAVAVSERGVPGDLRLILLAGGLLAAACLAALLAIIGWL